MSSRFSQQADYYARYRPDYPRELYHFIFNHPENRETAWDCATGSGQVAAVLAEHFDTVCASDISSEQMEHAPEKPNIEYFETPAEDSGFPAGLFDLITVAQALHWFDIEAFYEEVNRTAKSGGLLAVIGYGMVNVDPETDNLTHRFYHKMFDLYFGTCRKLLDDRYRSIPFPFDEVPTPEFEQQLEWSFRDMEGFFHSWSPVQQYKNEHGTSPVEPLLEELRTVWEPGTRKTVTFPVFMRLGRVTG